MHCSEKLIDINCTSEMPLMSDEKSVEKYIIADSNVVLYKNDVIGFLKSLPSKSIDIIITDPAYSWMNQMLKLWSWRIIWRYWEKWKKWAKWFEEFHDTEENYKSFLQECYRVLKNDRHIYLMFDSYSMLTLAPVVRDVFDIKNIICRDKVNIWLGHYFRRRHEFILFASKWKKKINSKSIPDIWWVKRVTNAKYPTQKPVEVFQLMLKASALKWYVVCDPFSGSWSSAIAALKEWCKFIWCDISDKAISISKDRIEKFHITWEDILQKQSHLFDTYLSQKIFNNG